MCIIWSGRCLHAVVDVVNVGFGRHCAWSLGNAADALESTLIQHVRAPDLSIMHEVKLGAGEGQNNAGSEQNVHLMHYKAVLYNFSITKSK